MSNQKLSPMSDREVERIVRANEMPPVPVAAAERIEGASRYELERLVGRAHEDDAGFDLRWVPEKPESVANFRLKPTPHVFGTGIRVAVPRGYMGEIRPRSGLSAKGVHVALGTIDSGYRGEVKVTLSCLIAPQYVLAPYERIAQLILVPVYGGGVQFVSDLPETARGENGHGSTGRF